MPCVRVFKLVQSKTQLRFLGSSAFIFIMFVKRRIYSTLQCIMVGLISSAHEQKTGLGNPYT
jgi:hypothetical protein